MRCPKCGYTSFDDFDHCKHCKKSIRATAEALMGTAISVAAPPFLSTAGKSVEGILPGTGNDIKSIKTGATSMDEVLAKMKVSDDFGEHPEEEEAEGLVNLDLGEVDLSDLREKEDVAEREQEAVEEDVPGADEAEDEDFSLENLDASNIGMAASASPSAVESGEYQPATKTGTALDNFDVGLNELLDVEESKKS